MAKSDHVYTCQACGAIWAKWAGKCEACGEWNTLVEEAARAVVPGAFAAPVAGAKRGKGVEFVDLAGVADPPPRIATGISEFDRVCGGGLVPASAILIGGDPGVGKSTLLLQAAASLARGGASVAYVTGEEAEAQVQERARRLKAADANVSLAAETDLRKILDGLKALKPDVVIVDSIQTLYADGVEAAPGTVAQVRACAHELVRFAKKSGAVVILVGHVTKDGQIAGPRVVEHLVDAVIYFEGERGLPFRILRAVKNRFGPTDEIGVFEMVEQGLVETPNPSALFLGDAGERPSGAAVFAGVEGSRPVLVEIQALAAPTAYGTPRRAVVGWDSARLAMILAVLETRCGLSFSGRDVYLSVAGGLRITEPAADLAVAAALVSALADKALPKHCVVFGEVALSGEVRPAGRSDLRLKEAAKLGFTNAFAPPQKKNSASGGVKLKQIGHIADLAAAIGIEPE
ncbi:DNA repair protein RadA [Candidatus Viadribacter manganicus]|uniref:DNA repair protein RadA n=1 Tax=Candidatus Viadribacter manganicus TaxID=1759059 RepID=A0A1B1AE09_9PROT|nr:DNA repair protein RadA [Candidatus Viadribacter manganicus]ANP44794.1 DNA repair protein RadA [Candidatus Viadribacter manganicus]